MENKDTIKMSRHQIPAPQSTGTLKTVNSTIFPTKNTPEREASVHSSLQPKNITWMNKIKSIASNIIGNIHLRPRMCIGPLPMEANHARKKLEEYRSTMSIIHPKIHEQRSNKSSQAQENPDQIIYPYISSKSWKPPSTHGLENSPRIIPDYYLSTCMNQDTHILKIDYKYTILDDVRNLRKLSQYQIRYIQHMSSEDKQEIIEEYNRVIDAFLSTL
jgi:hypothetical protein